jgi:calcineurin-like phosphoesterase family protein
MIQQLYPNVKHWADKGRVIIYSDPHFEDSDCLLMDKNWITPREQVKRINLALYPNDTLVLLGDIGNPKYIKNLKKGRKVLISGNHDTGLSNYEEYFDEIYGGPLFITDKILLSHEPIDMPFGLNIHGHVHDGKGGFDGEHHYNVCSNTIDYTPINLKDDIIMAGILKNVGSIHRLTIDKATEKKNNYTLNPKVKYNNITFSS